MLEEEVITMDELSDEIDSSFETFRDADSDCWDKCESYMNDKTVTDVTVEGINAKGVIARLEGIRGFIPASCLSLGYVEDLNDYLGRELKVHVIEVDEQKKRLILSAKSVLKEEAEAQKAEKLAALSAGETVEGTVDSVKPYGAFIKIDDDITGLVHVSQISRKRIANPSAVLKKGDVVKAKVLNTDNGKLSLSIKSLEEDKEVRREAEMKNVKLPSSGALVQNMGELLKNIKL